MVDQNMDDTYREIGLPSNNTTQWHTQMNTTDNHSIIYCRLRVFVAQEMTSDAYVVMSYDQIHAFYWVALHELFMVSAQADF